MGYICAVQHVVLMREVMRGQAQVVATILFCSGSSGYNWAALLDVGNCAAVALIIELPLGVACQYVRTQFDPEINTLSR